MEPREDRPVVARLAAMTLIFLASRALILCPLLVGLLTDADKAAQKFAVVTGAFWTFVLWLLLGWPEKIYRQNALKSLFGGLPVHDHWFSAVLLGLKRLLLSACALVPLCAVSSLWCYIFWFGNFKSLSIFKRIAEPFGGTYDLGAALMFFALALLIVVSMLVWHDDWLLDYVKTGAQAKKFKKKYKKQLLSLAWTNFLLSLPAWLLWAAVLLLAAVKDLTLDKGFMTLAMDAMSQMKTLMSNEVAVWLLLIFALVYLPLWMLRKYRAARLVARMEAKDAA